MAKTAKTAKTKINCLNCGIEVNIENKEIKRGNGKFCSRKCSGEYHSKHKSPLELNAICALCHQEFHITATRAARSKSGLYFCCAEHHDVAQRLGGIQEILPAHFGTGKTTYRAQVFNIEGRPKICERCKFDGHEAAIIVHHKDRNRNNNHPSNLEVLCCNCHAVEHLGEQ